MRGSQAMRPLVLAAVLGTIALAIGGGGRASASTRTSTAATKRHKAPAAVAPRLAFGEGAGPLGYVDLGVVNRQGKVDVHDVSYLSGGRRVAGYLLEPAGAKGRPGIVLVHGSGGDRGELLGDAIDLAKRGAVALTITEPSSAHPPPAPKTAAELLAESKAVTVDDVVAARRAASVLQSLPAVDPSKIGYLGWSAGAKTGAFVAASDRRFKALALLSGGADPVSAFVAAAPVTLRPEVQVVLGSVDPLRYLGFARPGTILLEDGTHDTVVPHQALENFVHAAPERTVVHWYATDHLLTTAAYTTAFDWLLRTLS